MVAAMSPCSALLRASFVQTPVMVKAAAGAVARLSAASSIG